jgi:beta-lactamase regulating signal transducer with metallopeptidase domain
LELILNWMWQGSVLAALTAAGASASRRVSASTRYWLLWLGLAGVLVLPILPLLAPAADLVRAQAVTPLPATDAVQLPAAPDWALLLLVGVWVLWAGYSLCRTAAAARQLRHLRTSTTPFPCDRERALTGWHTLRGHRPVRLAISEAVPGVSMLGLGTPIVAVSPAALEALTPQELETVLRHEWAHAQRFDDYARLAQALVRAVAGLHPGVWLLNRRLDLEREAACDDVAAEAGRGRELARSLARLATVPRPAVDGLAAGALGGSPLAVRVARLLDGRRNRAARGSVPQVAAGTVAIALAALVLASVAAVTVGAEAADPVAPGRTAIDPPRMPPLPTLAAAPASTPAASAAPAPAVTQTARRATGRTQGASDRPATPAAPSGGASPASSDGSGRPFPRSALEPLSASARADWQLPALHRGSSEPGPTPAPATASIAVEPLPAGDSTPWGAAADAGVAVGKGWQTAGESTGRFFTGLGRRIAGSF